MMPMLKFHRTGELFCIGTAGELGKPREIYCTFTALIRKPLIINGAGEGNRTPANIPF
jgi:hypothetical protein